MSYNPTKSVNTSQMNGAHYHLSSPAIGKSYGIRVASISSGHVYLCSLMVTMKLSKRAVLADADKGMLGGSVMLSI